MTPDEQAQLVVMYRAGVPVKQICKELSYCEPTIYGFLAKHRNICPRRKGGITGEQYELLKDLWRQGHTLKEMAQMVGRKQGTISSTIARHRHDFPHRRKTIETN